MHISENIVAAESEDCMKELINLFKGNSLFSFTYKTCESGSPLFLDVSVKTKGNQFFTKVYTKATNTGMTMHVGMARWPGHMLTMQSYIVHLESFPRKILVDISLSNKTVNS